MADDKLPGISKTREKSSLTGKQQAQNFAGKQIMSEVDSNVKTMEKLIAAVKENTEEQKKETETASTLLDTSQLLDKLDMSALQKEFQSAKQILENPKATPEEQSLALEQIETIKENAQSEEERREQQKKEDEANSFLAQISESSNRMASGLESFMGNVFAAGGLLATAMLFIDPETFIDTLRSAVEGITAVINSISSFIEGDFEGGFKTLEENLGSVLGVLTAGVLLLLPTIIKLVGSVASGFRKVVTFFKNFSGAKGVAGLNKLFGNIGKFVGRIFAPLTAIFFTIKGIQEGLETEGSILDKINAGFKEALTGIVAFILDLPKMLISGLFKLFGEEDAAEAVSAFNTKEFLGGIYDKITGFIGNITSGLLNFFNFNENDIDTSSIGGLAASLAAAIPNFLKTLVAGALGFFGADKAEEAVSNFSFTTLVKDLANLVWSTLKNIVGWFADIVTGETSFGETIGNISSVINEFIKGVLRAGLPDPSQPWYSVQGAAAQLIPSAIYEYAGLDPNTGERINPPPMETGDGDLGSDVLAQSQENAAASGISKSEVITVVSADNSSQSADRTNVVMEYNPYGPALEGSDR